MPENPQAFELGQVSLKKTVLQQCTFEVLARLVCTSSTLQRKNIAAGPEKYTQEFIKKQIEEFNIGKRHLANMMGEDPETFTQEGIDFAETVLSEHNGVFQEIEKHVQIATVIPVACASCERGFSTQNRVKSKFPKFAEQS
ncbi:UNVERIFIED_CONTAM: hypothetical protein FKN15_071100 [Acipenser sinensis]